MFRTRRQGLLEAFLRAFSSASHRFSGHVEFGYPHSLGMWVLGYLRGRNSGIDLYFRDRHIRTLETLITGVFNPNEKMQTVTCYSMMRLFIYLSERVLSRYTYLPAQGLVREATTVVDSESVCHAVASSPLREGKDEVARRYLRMLWYYLGKTGVKTSVTPIVQGGVVFFTFPRTASTPSVLSLIHVIRHPETFSTLRTVSRLFTPPSDE